MIAKLLKLISWSLLFVLLSCLDSTGRYRSVPVKPLTIKEIKADFNSLIANIESNYAPLALEEKFKNQGGYDIVKKKFYREVIQITQLPEDQRLEEFTRLVTRFFAQFQDAHMSVSFFPTAFPGLSKMQYLGVLGGRQGNDYLVTQIHPLILNADKFPIRPGDVITHIEHVGPGGHKMMTLTDYIDQYITKYRNLGNKESNYTFLMDSIFHRNSLSDLPPNTEYVKLRVLRSGMENNAEVVKLKWTEQDYANFEYDLKNLKNNQYVVNVKFKDKSGKVLKEFPVAYKDRAGNPVNLYEYYLNFFDANPNHYERFNGTFAFRDLDLLSMTTEAGLLDKLLKRKKSEGMERLHQQRNVPKNVEWIKGSDVFPAYIETIEVDGKKTKVGYWRIDTFSPEAGDDEIMKQVASTLEQFKKKGVKKIVVDALDNGGGRLSLVSLSLLK
ncbi:MAG: hypothetical protein H6621_01425 [Halobacteriovoraceae bacterium]|nr:hypothetical protein [Halobacteriovoraceae bacterium]